DKGEMIKAFNKHNVDHPWFYIAKNNKALNEIIDRITYPCIMKPTDNSGSRGVVLLHNKAELEKEYEYSHTSSRSGAVIIEEYLTGPEVSVEVIVYKGAPHVLQITDKLTTGAPHFVEMGHSQPSQLPSDVKDQIIDLASRAVLAVGIENGPAHVEMIVTENGPKMVELGARMGGDCITTHLVPLSTGIDMIKATIDIACGNEPDIEPKFNKGSAIRYFDVPCGVIKSIDGVDVAMSVDGVQEISFTKHVGDTVEEIGSSVDRVGFVIGQGESNESAVKVCENTISKVSIETL
ncbi:MAG: ATP-grasp domain-containing protein, partial [Lachnospiraceae bacterium]|nr:ATP-grasp domain-containing protein [Lachnospiraceae bacterium]